MSEIALNPAAAAGIAIPTPSSVIDLAMWAAELDAAYRLGGMLASTDFVPLSLKTLSNGKLKEPDQVAQNVAACILAGKALGLDPMNSIQNIFVVHGRPAMYARTMVALVLAAGHEVERVTATDQRVVYRGRRQGKTEWTEFEWTIARAQKAGYTTNKKYQTDPIAMLTAKCQAEASRIIAPDVLTGIAATSVEEVELDDLGEQVAVEVEAKPKRTITRKQQPAPALPAAVHEAPTPEEEPEPSEPEESPTEGITGPQLTKLNIILQEQGLTERDDKLSYLSSYLERPIASSKDLTKQEAHRLIDEHETDAA